MWRSVSAQPSLAISCSPPASSALQPPGSRSAPRGRARFCPHFYSGVTDNTLGGYNKLQEHRTHSRDEGGQGSFSRGFLRFLPSWTGGVGRARSQCPRSTSDHLPPRMASAGRLSPVQSSPAATRPAPVHPAGRAGHAGTCSLRPRGEGPRAGSARKLGGPGGKG